MEKLREKKQEFKNKCADQNEMREEKKKANPLKNLKKCLLATGYNQNFSHKAHTKSCSVNIIQ